MMRVLQARPPEWPESAALGEDAPVRFDRAGTAQKRKPLCPETVSGALFL